MTQDTKEGLTIVCLILAIIVSIAGAVGVISWFIGPGAERSKYSHCIKEYDRAYEGRDLAGGFRYCYEKTYK